VIDYRGAGLLTAGLTLLILGVLEGGQAWAWDSPAGVAVLGLGVLLLVLFAFAERRAVQPMLPVWVFQRRLLVVSGQLAIGVGAILLGLSSYVPTYAQDVLGTGPLVAGFALAALTLGWPISASQAGRLYLRFGFRTCALLGTSLVVIGSALMLTLDAHSSVLAVGAFCLVIGLGMGLTAAPTLIAAQSSVGWDERGVVTANNIFLRSLGSSLGVAVFGAIANAVIGPGAVTAAHLTTAVHRIFIGIVVVAVAMVVLAALMPATADESIFDGVKAQQPVAD
jgi:MFS family permease